MMTYSPCRVNVAENTSQWNGWIIYLNEKWCCRVVLLKYYNSVLRWISACTRLGPAHGVSGTRSYYRQIPTRRGRSVRVLFLFFIFHHAMIWPRRTAENIIIHCYVESQGEQREVWKLKKKKSRYRLKMWKKKMEKFEIHSSNTRNTNT